MRTVVTLAVIVALAILREAFKQIDAPGRYLLLPFCERMCPYCPCCSYNKELVQLGVDQVAAYPLFLFPCTPMWRVVGPGDPVVNGAGGSGPRVIAGVERHSGRLPKDP